MMSDSSFVLQTLNSNLYYLRTIREFATNIQLSFLENNSEYIDTAKDFSDRCEELGRRLLNYANGNVSKEALDSKIFVTDYTLDSELLTEKLFNINIDTTLTEKELSLTPGFPNNPSVELINSLNEINKEALVLVTNFIDFCRNISLRMNNNELFSYSYISLIEAMIVEANLYKTNLERIIARDSINPTFVIDYEYLFNNLLQSLASFIRGYVDPRHAEIIIRAGAFSSEFGLLASNYKNAIINPEKDEELRNRTLDTLDRFRKFLSNIIEDILNSKTYFIIEPIFLDNILTTVNYFEYILISSNFDSNNIINN